LPTSWLTLHTRNILFPAFVGVYTAFTTGAFFWLLRGIAHDSWPLIAANAVAFSLASSALVVRARYGNMPCAQGLSSDAPSLVPASYRPDCCNAAAQASLQAGLMGRCTPIAEKFRDAIGYFHVISHFIGLFIHKYAIEF
jgi:hypothetical protein